MCCVQSGTIFLFSQSLISFLCNYRVNTFFYGTVCYSKCQATKIQYSTVQVQLLARLPGIFQCSRAISADLYETELIFVSSNLFSGSVQTRGRNLCLLQFRRDLYCSNIFYGIVKVEQVQVGGKWKTVQYIKLFLTTVLLVSGLPRKIRQFPIHYPRTYPST